MVYLFKREHCWEREKTELGKIQTDEGGKQILIRKGSYPKRKKKDWVNVQVDI